MTQICPSLLSDGCRYIPLLTLFSEIFTGSVFFPMYSSYLSDTFVLKGVYLIFLHLSDPYISTEITFPGKKGKETERKPERKPKEMLMKTPEEIIRKQHIWQLKCYVTNYHI